MVLWVVVGIVIVALVLAALYLEIYFYEGIHLGPRVQSWLYDRWAAQYDRDKQASQAQDAEMLARPLVERLVQAQACTPQTLVLDVATGTGRFPLALLNESAFTGRVIALDISREMLARAAAKLDPHQERVTLVRCGALPLPFPDDTFEVVSCLEALELMPNMHEPLAELARVLRPGGILLTSRGTEASGRVGKVCRADRFANLLRAAGFEQVEIMPWWKVFDRVWARKPGQLTLPADRALTDILRCPACKKIALTVVSPQALRCTRCNAEIPVTAEGIILCPW